MDQQAPVDPKLFTGIYIRTGLVAVLCKCIVLSFPAATEKLKQQLFSLTATSTPFHFGISAEFSQKHFPHMALSLCLATLLLWELKKQVRAVKPILHMLFFFFKYVQSLLEWHFCFFPFPMWQSFLQIVDIPSKILLLKKHVTDVFIPKSLLYC